MSKGNLYEFDGEMLSAKVIAGRVDLAPSTIYKYLKDGYSIEEAVQLGKAQSTKAFKAREKTNNMMAKKYPYKNYPEMTVAKICELEGISKEPMYRRLKKGMTPEEAVMDIKRNIVSKYPYLGGYYSKYQLELLTGVSRWHLDKNLIDGTIYTEEDVVSIIDSYKQQDIYSYAGMSLYSYCILMQYNYNVIYYSMKKYNLTPGEAIKYYLQCGQMTRFSYKYALGDVLLYHFLIKMKLDDRYVTDRIRKGQSEEDAIVDAIFLNKEKYKTRGIRTKLRALYCEFSVADDVEAFKRSHGLDDDDIAFLNLKVNKAKEILFQYKLFAIISLVRTSGETAELKAMLENVGVTMEQLLELKDELLSGFVIVSDPENIGGIKHIWKKENMGS